MAKLQKPSQNRLLQAIVFLILIVMSYNVYLNAEESKKRLNSREISVPTIFHKIVNLILRKNESFSKCYYPEGPEKEVEV